MAVTSGFGGTQPGVSALLGFRRRDVARRRAVVRDRSGHHPLSGGLVENMGQAPARHQRNLVADLQAQALAQDHADLLFDDIRRAEDRDRFRSGRFKHLDPRREPLSLADIQMFGGGRRRRPAIPPCPASARPAPDLNRRRAQFTSWCAPIRQHQWTAATNWRTGNKADFSWRTAKEHAMQQP